jgi:alpha-D-ribose 1-methylphosphonate 5-triphosphate diphosphatase
VTYLIRNGLVLLEQGLAAIDLLAGPDGIRVAPGMAGAAQGLDAGGLMVLPGIVDMHGDAFERQIMPRPGVGFPLDLALIETDRQLVANGITTACHAVTWSWEPGLRGADTARALLATLEAMRPALAADTHFHLRHETFNFEGEAEILDWIAARRIRVLAFNDHMEDIVRSATERKSKLTKMVERSGIGETDFVTLVNRFWARRDEVPGLTERLAAAAVAAGVTLLSHDDRDPGERRWYRARGCRVAEFPKTGETAREAVAAGEDVIFGAPNVIRGGSHTGCPSAGEMVAGGLCTVLASDYYYPALAQAPLRLEREGAAGFATAWALVSTNPARSLGLADRGRIADGLRADLVLAAREENRLRIVATLAGGRLVHLAEGARLGAG